MRLTPILVDVGSGVRRNATMTVSLVVTVAISLFLVGIGLWTHSQAARSEAFYYGKAQVGVFFCNAEQATDPANPQCAAGAVTGAQEQALRARLTAMPQVARVVHESQKQAYANFKAEYPDSAITANVSPADMQESLRVQLSSPAGYAAVLAATQGRPGVQQVQDLQSLLAPLFGSLRTFGLGAVALAVLLVGVAVLLIWNTIRLAAYGRRRETEIMRLVGASSTAVRLPFVLQSVVAGLVGAALADLGLVAWEKGVVLDRLRADIPVTPWIGWSEMSWIFVVLALLGVAVSAIPAAVSLRRYLHV
jgi:cell division transport system permease protein